MSPQNKLPENKQAEAALLGSMLLDSEHLQWMFADVPVEAFYWPEHRVIYEVLQEVVNDADVRRVDLIILREAIGDKIAEAGGVEYLVELTDTVPSADSAEYYSRIVLDKWRERLLYCYASELATNALNGDESVAEKYAAADKGLRELVSGHVTVEAIDVSETIDKITFEKHGVFIPTGYYALDSLIYGLGQGDMITIAGRPGMGKTALMLDIALNLAGDGRAVAIFSMEMTATQLQQRMLCVQARVDLGEAIKDQLDETQKEEIDQARQWVHDSGKIYIDSTPGLTPDQLKAKVIGLQMRKGIEAVFIDYLQLMRPGSKRELSRYESITLISNAIKQVGLMTELPVVVCSQLSRKVEERNNKKPRLSDLRDSGAIEQDSDVVILMYREDYYTSGDTGAADLHIAKSRRSDTGHVPLTFFKESVHFESEGMEG